MIKIIVLFLVCIKISTGYYEEYSGYNSFPSIDSSGRSNLPIPVNYRDLQVRRRKPCPHRRNNGPDQEWVPSFRSMVTKPLTNYGLEPQSLKNENVNDVADDRNKASERLPAEPSPNNETISDSDTDPNDAKGVLGRLNRRSNGEDEQTLIEDYDCDIELNTEAQVTSGSPPKTTVGVEQKVIEMLKDCLNKKQKHIGNKLQDEPIAGSRRSMGDADIDNENDDSESTDSDDVESTTEVSEDNTNSNVPSLSDRVYSITLRPGKLYNELQNAAKASGIAKYPVSRRMQDSSRICYACSSSTNPTCWAPNKMTTIKYCSANQNCITKSFGEKDTLTVIRDCAKSCDSSGLAGIEPKYNKCKVCYKDLCNSATINSYSMLIIFLIITFKCAF